MTDRATSRVASQAPDRALAAAALLDATAADIGALTGTAHDPRRNVKQPAATSRNN